MSERPEPTDPDTTPKGIFLASLRLPTEEERHAYVREVCGEDGDLRSRVHALLAAHGEDDSFLVEPAVLGETVSADAFEVVTPTEIGPYKLRERIGEGGFGEVWVADQREPVQREVALKLLKPGMDTKEVLARFAAERQALALMQHQSIAQVYDGGMTQGGRPYFVMELVRGVRIDEYCDQCNLPLRDRLSLFVRVCRAVQHAHQKGVIHRDIKPSNVLVAIDDGRPLPKVIDFGMAKALGQRLTEQTLHTRFAQMIGTPQYMSPEQAEMSALDVDTRSDVYERSDQHAGAGGCRVDRPPPAHGTAAARSDDPGRPRLDRDAGAREGSHPALRGCRCPGRGRRALPPR
jgi:serine/threonine protein kinase